MIGRKDEYDLNAYDEVCQWERTEAVKLLSQCGLEAGMTVMDIGCGYVHYTIPAAIAAGTNGSVIAIDKLKKIIKQGSIFSFLAFKDLSGYKPSLFEGVLKEVSQDIKASGFTLKSEIPFGGVHFDHFHSSYHWKRYSDVRLASFERGTVYNFIKAK